MSTALANAATINIPVASDAVQLTIAGSSGYTQWQPETSTNEASFERTYLSGWVSAYLRTYIQFSLTPLAGMTITSATLNIYLGDVWSESSEIWAAKLLHAFNSSQATGDATDGIWAEQSTANWIIYDQPSGWISFDVTTFLSNDLNAGYSWSCWSVHPNDSGSLSEEHYRGITFSSGGGENAPYLLVNVVPVPSTLLLIGPALLGLLGLRRLT